MINNWVSTKKLDEKKKATQIIVNYFPNICDNGHAVLMPSITCYDVEELKRQNKINNSTFLHVIDNLASPELKNKKGKNTLSTKDSSFRSILKKRFREIIGSDIFYNKNKNNFVLGKKIQDISLLNYASDKNLKGFDLIYADTCGTYCEKMMNWIIEKSTIDSLKQNGIFAITMLLSRKKIEGDITFPSSNPDLLLFGKSKKVNSKKMFIIANDIEKNTSNVLKSKALIYYEDYFKSPMGVFIFEKK